MTHVAQHLPNPDLLRRSGQKLQHDFVVAQWNVDVWPSWTYCEVRKLQPAPSAHHRLASEAGHSINLTWVSAYIGILTFALAASEYVKERCYATLELVEANAHEWVQEALLASGLTADEFQRDTATLMNVFGQRTSSPMSVGHALHDIESTVDSFIKGISPFRLLELSDALGDPATAHTIRTRLAKLRAIYYRMRAPNGPFGIIARAWVAGKLDLDVAGELLNLTRSDLVAALETHGYARTVDNIVLNDTKASEALARLRGRRLARRGRPELNHDLVRRDVVATQRIEGVEAQRWLPRSS